MRFQDRRAAGRALAGQLGNYANRPDVTVLGLPRGGVPVAFEVATRLGAPLDVCLVRKLGVPGYRELAFGAIAPGGVRVINPDVFDRLDNGPQILEEVTSKETEVLKQRERLYRGERPPLDLKNRTVILVDDGMATGATMRAAVAVMPTLGAARTVVAVPVAPPDTVSELRSQVDDIVCCLVSEYFSAVSQFYIEFSQTTDEEVQWFLKRSQVSE
ncbi:MAG TPA: phosphoribosyltransferase [Chthoniobacterales bacterium]